MNEYIEREAICYQLEKQESIDGQPRAIRRARRIVESFPAADVVPVRHGRWIWTETGNTDYEQFWICSECKDRMYYQTRYCPDCGARMEG